jgi:excisionase family DNA binding protein
MPYEFDQDWYSMEEVTEILNCSEKAIHRMMKRCELPGQPHGKSFRFYCDDLEAFYHRCERTGSWPDQRR